MARGMKRSVFGHKIRGYVQRAEALKAEAKSLLDQAEPLRRVEAYYKAMGGFPVPVDPENIRYGEDGYFFTYGNNESLGLLNEKFKLTADDWTVEYDEDGEYLSVTVESICGNITFFVKNESSPTNDVPTDVTIVTEDNSEELVTV